MGGRDGRLKPEHRRLEHVDDAARDGGDRRAADGDPPQESAEKPGHHSDRGVQYACLACRELLQAAIEIGGMRQSMSRAANCYENAMMERLWATLKKELVHGRTFRNHAEARLAIFEWIEIWYQRKRIHGSLGYVSPEAFEAAARAGQDGPAVLGSCGGPASTCLRSRMRYSGVSFLHRRDAVPLQAKKSPSMREQGARPLLPNGRPVSVHRMSTLVKSVSGATQHIPLFRQGSATGRPSTPLHHCLQESLYPGL